MGDYCEFITPEDPRMNFASLAPERKAQELAKCYITEANEIIKILKPISSQCMGLLWGNHERAIAKYHWYPILDEKLCPELNTRNLGCKTLLKVKVKDKNSVRYTLVIHAWHGSSKATTQKAIGLPAAIKKVQDKRKEIRGASVYAMGHHHLLGSWADPPELDSTPNNEIIDRKILCFLTGSYFKTLLEGTDATYAEEAGMPPTAIGSPFLECRVVGDKGELRLRGDVTV